MNNHKKALFALFILSLLGLASYALTLWPRHVAVVPNTLPTHNIDHKTSIGGVVADSSEGSNKTKSATNDSSPNKELSAVISQSAPKQDAIKKTITKEYPYHALGTSNDPLTQSSWALSATNSLAAWDRTTGNGAIVAVIDTGFGLSHQDLLANWTQNSGEIGTTQTSDTCWTGTAQDKKINNCDDDSNGYVDDWRGWDFVSQNNSPQAGDINPTGMGTSHGTEVAGLVGARGNNGIGIATTSWNNTIMPLQALDDGGTGYTSDVVAAIYYAVDNGAAVINMSFGGATEDPALTDAINYAFSHDVVIVAAAGNCGSGNEAGCATADPGAMGYPALNDHVISVGATTSSSARASFSSYGQGLDVMAPGSGSLVSPVWTNSNGTSAYATSLYGTSFSSPIVASYVGLLKSIRPSSSVDDITAIVDGTATKVSAMNSNVFTSQYGHGLIDVDRGLQVALGLNAPSGVTPTLLQTGSEVSEHTFTELTLLASGCIAGSGEYCTVWAHDENGFDRYTPYTLGDIDGQTGWNWEGSSLGAGLWKLKSRSGNAYSSTPYYLFQK